MPTVRREVINYKEELEKAIEIDSIYHLFEKLILMVDECTMYVSRFERCGKTMKSIRDTDRYGEWPGRILCNRLSEIETFSKRFRQITTQVRKQRKRQYDIKKESLLEDVND